MSLGNPFLRRVSMHLHGNDDGAGFGVKGTSLNNTGVLGPSNNGAGVFGNCIGARWLKPLHHFTRLSALLTIGLVVAGAKAQANGFFPGEIVGAVSRYPDTLDVFAADDYYGGMYHAGWYPVFGWQGWDNISYLGSGTLFAALGLPVTPVSTTTDEIDVFTVANNGHVYTARTFSPSCCYAGWTQIGDLSTWPGSYVSAVSRSTGKFDIFVAGKDGQVWTAGYEPAFGLRGWSPLPGIGVGSTTQVGAASPFTDQLAIFAVDGYGKLQTASWYPYFGGYWTSWQQIGGVQLSPGAPVTAISRGYGELELFVTDVNGHIQTTSWYPSFSGWKSIGVAAPGATVTGVSRHPEQLDIFVVWNQQVWTQGSPSLSSGFNINSWRQISGLKTAEGSAVTAVSRSLDKLDVFVIGFDYNLWTGAWEPDFVQPGVSDWHVFQVPVPNGLPAYP